MGMKGKRTEELQNIEGSTAEGSDPVPFQVSESAGDLPEPVFMAAKFFGVDRQFLLAWKVYEEREEVVLLTRGGKKVTWKPGMKVEPLTMEEVTGIPPKKH